MRRRHEQERGAVALELVLASPVLLMIVFGGWQLGRVLVTRHALGEATGYATRAAAISGVSDSGKIQLAIRTRMQKEAARCQSIGVVAKVEPGDLGMQSLKVTATCTLVPLFRSAWLANLGPTSLQTVATMPIDRPGVGLPEVP